MKSNLVKNTATKPWLAFVIITVVGLVVYCNIYRAPFVFDDLEQIERNVEIKDLSECFSPKQLFSQRPLVRLTFALNYRFGKVNVFGYHLVNVLIHITNGFLAYFLALIIFKRLSISPVHQRCHSNSPKSKVQSYRFQVDPTLGTHNLTPKTSEMVLNTSQSTIDNQQSAIFLMALLTALIFVVHPIQTQAVTYTVQRYTSMAAMFYFLAILSYIKARILHQRVGDGGPRSEDRHRIFGKNAFSFQLSAYFALAFLCGILAFLSKQNAASFPGAILLTEYILFAMPGKPR